MSRSFSRLGLLTGTLGLGVWALLIAAWITDRNEPETQDASAMRGARSSMLESGTGAADRPVGPSADAGSELRAISIDGALSVEAEALDGVLLRFVPLESLPAATSGSAAAATRTGEGGRFTIELPAPGRYAVDADPGAGAYRVGEFAIERGRFLRIDVRVARVSGRVSEAGREPVPRAVIRFEMRGPSVVGTSGRPRQVTATAISDADGRFEIGLLPARYVVSAGGEDPRWSLDGLGRRDPKRRSYSPIERELEVARGATIEHFDLELAPAAIVAGFVRFASGEPLGGAEMSAVGHALGAYAWADGSFELRGLPAGRVTVEAFGRGLVARAELSVVEGGDHRVDLVATQGTMLQVIGVAPDGEVIDFDTAVVLDDSGRPLHRPMRATLSAAHLVSEDVARDAVRATERGVRIGPYAPGSYWVEVGWSRASGERVRRPIEIFGDPFQAVWIEVPAGSRREGSDAMR